MLSRREFNWRLLGGLAAASLGGAALPAATARAQEPAAVGACRIEFIKPARLRDTLEQLSRFGHQPDGGTTRLGFSDADLAARNWLLGLLRNEGLDVTIDAAANIHAHRAGQRDDLPALWFGSHMDTVPEGGNFDGCLGSMSALEVLRALNEQGLRTEHPLEMVVFTNEEGVHYHRGLFGSRALAGLVAPEELQLVDNDGVPLAEWIRRYGGDPDRIATMQPAPGSIHSYLELHIEQGGVLWASKIPIGIVEGIVGINEYRVTLEGVSNHAGTTPMNQRHDALVTASKIILAVRELVTAEPGRQVGTVGQIRVEPDAANVIPGHAVLSVELRDLSLDKIDDLGEQIRTRAAALAAEDGVGFTMEKLISYEPALADRRIRFQIQKVAEAMRAATLTLPSGAGHDAQDMARLCPMGMIFVPSVDGISHAPKEFTPWENCACGCEALYRTILRLDQVERLALDTNPAPG